MCGIAGLFLKQGVVAPACLDDAAKKMFHRGPDGKGTYIRDGLGLIHTRLSIIDLAQGGQPLYSQDQQQVLIANGEIYNYIELKKELSDYGHQFSTHSDCEPILAAHLQYGEDFLRKLHGMFAFALYDSNTGELILARDRLGIKPLFIYEDNAGVYFGSELKALMAVAGKDFEVNPAGIVQFLQNNFTSAQTSLFKDIGRVLPGEVVVIKNGEIVNRRRYWSPSDIASYSGSHEAAISTFDALMHEVMHTHIRTDVPFGLFLSGGVDSAVLLSMLDRQIDGPLRTYSVGFPDSQVANELNAAAAIAKQFNTEHIVLELSQQELLHALPHAIWAADELMGDYANLPVAMLAKRAAQDLKVVFSGEGGDEVFAGYARYRQSFIKRGLKQLCYPGSGGFRMSKTINRSWESQLFSSELNELTGVWADPFKSAWQALPATMPLVSRMQAVDIQTWLADDLLVKADRMLMAFGVEGRVPFLDHRVVEFGLSLPSAMKISGKTGKYFLRQWAESYLPKNHLYAPKRGFTVPIGDWLKGSVLDQLELLLPIQPGIQRWFNSEGIKNLVKRQRSSGDVTQAVWRIWQFAIWHRIFIDNNGVEPPVQTDPIGILQL